MFISGSRIVIVLAACVFAGAEAEALKAPGQRASAPALRAGLSETEARAEPVAMLLFSPVPFGQAKLVQPPAPSAGVPRKSVSAAPLGASDLLYDARKFSTARLLHPVSEINRIVPSAAAATSSADTSPSNVLRSGLIEEVPAEPGFPKITTGTAAWTLEPADPRGAEANPAARVDLDIPGAGLKAELRIRRRSEAPNAIILQLAFRAPLKGGVRLVDAPRVRRAGAREGEPLLGRVLSNRGPEFLFELSAEPVDLANNLQRLLGPPWLDIILKPESGREQILTIEKGSLGDRILRSALQPQ